MRSIVSIGPEFRERFLEPAFSVSSSSRFTVALELEPELSALTFPAPSRSAS